MDQDVPQNPASPATEGTPNPTHTASTALQDGEPTVSHKAYAQLQTKFNNLKKQFDDLTTSYAAATESQTQTDALAQQRLDQLTEANTLLTAARSELTTAQQRLVKLDALTQLIDDPHSGLELSPGAQLELLKLLDKMPGTVDVEEARETIRQFAQFGQAVAAEQQQQTRAGMTPGMGGATPPASPATREDWLKELDGKAPEDPAWDLYREWSFKHT